MGHSDGASSFEKGMEKSRRATGSVAPWWRQMAVLVLAACLVAVVVVLLIVIATLSTRCTSVPVSDNTTVTLPDYTEGSTEIPVEPEFKLSDGTPIVHRSEWSDKPPDFRRSLHHPTPYVVIGHTAGVACRHKTDCFELLRSYQDQHRTIWRQPEIAYNFLIDVEGNVYEGRGWDATNNYQSYALRCNLGVALMGNFEAQNVTAAMMQSLQQLLALGVRLGKLDPDYRLVAHNQIMSTLSPGKYVLQAIEAWPHRCLRDCSAGVQCIAEDLFT